MIRKVIIIGVAIVTVVVSLYLNADVIINPDPSETVEIRDCKWVFQADPAMNANQVGDGYLLDECEGTLYRIYSSQADRATAFLVSLDTT